MAGHKKRPFQRVLQQWELSVSLQDYPIQRAT